MNSQEIKNFIFNKSAFGYKVDEVAGCLNDISEYVASLEKKVQDLEEDVEIMHHKSDKMREDEDAVKDILVSAQEFSNGVIDKAKTKSQEILQNAQQQSDNILQQAQDKADFFIEQATQRSKNIENNARTTAQKELEYLKRVQKEVSSFKTELLDKYKLHLDTITKIPEIDKSLIESGSFLEAPRYDSPNIADSMPNKTYEKKETAQEFLSPKSKSENSASSFSYDEFKQKDEEKEIPKKEDKKKKRAKNSAFKITITDKKDKIEKNAKDRKIEPNKQESFEKIDYKSRFGELQFGETPTNPEKSE